ncbi:MAG: sodium:calcium antiporter [Sphingomonadaceae bacterium]
MANSVQTIVLLVAGLVGVVLCARLFLTGAVGISRKFGLSEVVVAGVVVAIGTSAPELAINIVASLNNEGDVVMSNIIGSNIVNLGFGVGIAGLIQAYRPFPKAYRFVTIFGLAGTALLLVNTIWSLPNPVLGRGVGIILLGGAVYYLSLSVKEARHGSDRPEKVAGGNIGLMIGQLIIGSLGMAVTADLTVNNAVVLANLLNVPESVIGATIVAAGGSLPEIVACVIAARAGHPGVAVGNVVGSQLFNVFAVLGVSTLVSPVHYSASIAYDLVALTLISFVFLAAFYSDVIRKNIGWIMLLSYAGYAIYLVASTVGS